MTTDDTTLSDLGVLLEQHRGSLSKREAARRAGISEGRWRQIVTGQQKAGGGLVVPVNPRRETVIAMAAAVGADVNDALRRAGMAEVQSDTSGPEVMHAAAGSHVDQDTSITARAIREDPDLTDRARQHLLDQYDMLRELSQAAHRKDSDRPETAAGQRPLRAVARKRPPRSTP